MFMRSYGAADQQKTWTLNKLQNATNKLSQHFMDAVRPWQRPAGDAFESPQGTVRDQPAATILWVASTSDLTAATDFSNMPRSLAFSSTWTMRATPPAPITTGTPI